MSNSKYTRKTEGRHKREKWWMLCGGLVIGAIIALGSVYIATSSSDSSSKVCPEFIGHIADASGSSVFVAASCDNHFVVVPSGAGRYSLQAVADKVLKVMGTGTAQVLGERINFDMGNNPSFDAWIKALNTTT